MAAYQLLLHVHHLKLVWIQGTLIKQSWNLLLLCIGLIEFVEILSQENEVVKELFLLFSKRRILQNTAHSLSIRHIFIFLVKDKLVLPLEILHNFVKLFIVMFLGKSAPCLLHRSFFKQEDFANNIDTSEAKSTHYVHISLSVFKTLVAWDFVNNESNLWQVFVRVKIFSENHRDNAKDQWQVQVVLHMSEALPAQHDCAQAYSEDEIVGQVTDNHLSQEGGLNFALFLKHVDSRCKISKGIDEAESGQLGRIHWANERVPA